MTLFVILAFITLIALLYAEEKFRGKRAWDRYRREAEARGVKLDFAAHIPPPIPDAENGANTPFIQSWFPKPKPDETNQWPTRYSEADRLIGIKRRTKGTGSQDDRAMTDLTAWQEGFARLKKPKDKNAKPIERESHAALDPKEQAKAALAVLEELKIYEPALTELRVASQHARVRYPVEYKLDDPFMILLPHLAKIKGLVQVLRLQTSAELAAGQMDRAFADLRLMLWLCNSLEDEPFLISVLVRIAGQQITTQPLWEGMARHQWSEAQLKELQERFSRVNFADSASRSIASERAAGIAIIQTTIKRNNLAETLIRIDADPEGGAKPSFANKVVGAITPRGWLYFEMVNNASMMEGLVAHGWDAETKVFHPRTLDANEKDFEAQIARFPAVWHHQVFAHALLPALTRASMKCARAQSTANQAALACALERYHLAHGGYPESLSQLVPQYLAKVPDQAISDEPMKYIRSGDTFTLYSIGWDGVDNGGSFLTSKSGVGENGDWVWRSSP